MQLGAELEEASWVSGGAWFATFRRIILPLTAPLVLTVGMFTFASSAKNVTHMVLLSTGVTQPLSVLQLRTLTRGEFEAASVAGVILMLLSMGVALVGYLLGMRIGPSRQQ